MNGDPIELLFFEKSDWVYHFSSKETVYKKNSNKKLRIRKTFYFNSELKRMSSMIHVNNF